MSGPPAANDVNDSDDRMVEIVHSARLRDAAGVPVIVLVGVPGAGKSTVGHALAERLGVGFRDTDGDVEATTGRVIADIFVESGESEFRRLEAEAVSTALAEHDGVLALGGGAVIDPATRALLVGGPVVWLRVGLAAASQRAGLSGARPVLLGNVRAQMKSLMDARAPLYTEVARLIVDTDELTVNQTVETILAGLGMDATTGDGSEEDAASAAGDQSAEDAPSPESGPSAPDAGALAPTAMGSSHRTQPGSPVPTPDGNPDRTKPGNPVPTPDREARP